jgi:hypothetical protein
VVQQRTLRWNQPAILVVAGQLKSEAPKYLTFLDIPGRTDAKLVLVTHRIHGAAIYGNIYHQYTPNVSIYTSTMDPMGYNISQYQPQL